MCTRVKRAKKVRGKLFEKLQKNYSMWNAFQVEVLSYVDTLQKTKSKEPK